MSYLRRFKAGIVTFVTPKVVDYLIVAPKIIANWIAFSPFSFYSNIVMGQGNLTFDTNKCTNSTFPTAYWVIFVMPKQLRVENLKGLVS